MENNALRALFRQSCTLSVVAIVGVVCALGGCRNCDDRLCLTVKLLREKAVNYSDRCCTNPAASECGPEVYDRFNDMLDLILNADDACHAGNIDALKGIWEEFKELLPDNWILLLCDHYRDLDQWIQDACHPYYNSAVVFSQHDSFDINIQLAENANERHAKQRTPFAPSDPEVVGRHFVVEPGSTLYAETWAGVTNAVVTGSFTMTDLVATDYGGWESVVHALEFDLIDVEGGMVGTLQLDQSAGRSVVVVNEAGSGRLGVAVSLRYRSLEHPDLSLDGHVDTAWIELPIQVDKSGVRLGGVDPLSGFDIAPIHPETAACLYSNPDDVPVFVDAATDPCDMEVGPNGELWFKRSSDWYWRVTTMFPDCFDESDG